MRSRAARACPSCACAITSAASSSGLDSSARISPLRTVCPGATAKRKRRPLISAAILISVGWTTPGGRCATTPGLKITKARIPATTTSAAKTAIVWNRWAELDGIGAFRGRASPRHDKSEQEIDGGEQPQIEPIGPYLDEPCAHLPYAHQAVDRRLAREYAAHVI